MMPNCFKCKTSHETHVELAQHILGRTKHSRKSVQWAQRMILMEKKKPDRVALTDEQKQARQDTHIELSGESRIIEAVCLRGKHASTVSLPVEYANSPDAWKIHGSHIINCGVCRNNT